MDLEEFIEASLTQIVSGIQAASEGVAKAGGELNPRIDLQDSSFPTYQGTDGRKRILQQVEFDVAVTVSSERDGGGSASLNVAGVFSIAGEGGAKSGESSISRVKFSVPLGLPVGEE